MFKAILLISLCVIFVTATISPQAKTAQFLVGLTSGLNIETTQKFEECVDVPLVAEVEKIINELKSQKINPIQLLQDVTAMYKDVEAVKLNCAEALQAYENYFSDFESSLKQNRYATLFDVGNNVLNQYGAILNATQQIQKDFNTSNFANAGIVASVIIQDALAGYVPSI